MASIRFLNATMVEASHGRFRQIIARACSAFGELGSGIRMEFPGDLEPKRGPLEIKILFGGPVADDVFQQIDLRLTEAAKRFYGENGYPSRTVKVTAEALKK